MLAVLNVTSDSQTSSNVIVTNVRAKLHSAISDRDVIIFQWICLTFICQGIDIFGIGTNIINIVCFIKQGFNDPVNVSFLGLAISDIGCLSTLVWSNICLTPAFSAADLPFSAVELMYLTSGMPHTAFTRVTAWTTALITLERCLCITVPLKVNNVVTPKRVSIVLLCVFTIFISCGAPVYVVNRLAFKFYPHRNRTLIGLVMTEDREKVEKISFAVSNVFVPFSAFSVIAVCTIILVVKLRSKTKWRMTSTNNSQAGTVSSRNQKVAKMVVMISSLFIACFVPVSIMFIAMSVDPKLSVNGNNLNTIIVFGGVGSILESVNSAVNIFIYYHMSSKYRNVFRNLFLMDISKPSKS